MFLTGKIELVAYEDSQQTEFPMQKILDMSKAFSDNNLGNAQTLRLELAGGANHTIDLNGINTPLNVNRFFLFSDRQAVNVYLSGVSPSFVLKANEPGYMPGAIVQMKIENADPTNATTVTVVLFVEA
jgi:hypothetical protein